MFGFFKKKKQPSRKEKSEALLKSRNIKINYNLPRVESEEETTIRGPKEIAQRLVVLCTTSAVAFNGLSGEEALEYLRKYKMDGFITPDEQAFLANPTPEAKNKVTWKCECIWVLFWVLNIVEELPFPDTMCNLNDIPEEDYPIMNLRDPHIFINRIESSRSTSEILDANDLYYRYDWACVDARVHGRVIEEINQGIVYERHYALNWLINYMGQDWDDISCDT